MSRAHVGEVVKLRCLWPPAPELGAIMGTKSRSTGRDLGRRYGVEAVSVGVRAGGRWRAVITCRVLPRSAGPVTFWWWWARRRERNRGRRNR